MVKDPELDKELVLNIQNSSCNDSLKTLIDRHSGLFNNVIQRYIGAFKQKHIYVTDVYNDKDFIIYKAALTYKFDKGMRVSSYIASSVRFYCLRLLKNSRTIPLCDDTLNRLVESGEKQDLDSNTKQYIHQVIESFNDPILKKIYRLRFFHDSGKKLTWKTIGKQLNVSGQTVLTKYRQSIRTLKARLEKE